MILVSEPTVVLFGGTFDPPHVGHLHVVERVRRLFLQSRILISVAPAPAGAAQQHKAPGASYEQRLAMCRLNFAPLILSGAAEITGMEEQLPKPNYTVATLRHAGEQFPTERWALLIGQDQLEKFASWREPQEILKRAELVVIGRGQDQTLDEVLVKLATELGMSHEALSARVHLLQETVSDAASRDLRTDPSLGSKKGWLVPEVAAYIQQHGLYQK